MQTPPLVLTIQRGLSGFACLLAVGGAAFANPDGQDLNPSPGIHHLNIMIQILGKSALYIIRMATTKAPTVSVEKKISVE